jgi:plastocyanin
MIRTHVRMKSGRTRSPPRSPYWVAVRAVLVIAALLGVCAAVVLVTAGGQSDSRAQAQELPKTAVISPPAGHHADPGLKTYVFRVGPFSIGGYQTYRHNDIVQPPPVKGSIVGMDVRIVDPSGAEIPQSQVMLHHNVFTNGGPDDTRKDGACPNNAVRERFYGSSEELRPLTLPKGYGYPTSPQDHWKMIWMAMNHRHQRRDAYVEYRVTVDPDPSLEPVTPYWLSVVPCISDPMYTVPGGGKPGAVTKRTKTFTMPKAGHIVAVGGHLHGGSYGLRLSEPACGDRTIALSDPTYAPEGDPLYRVHPLLHEPDPKSIDWHQWSDGWAIGKGDKLRVTAAYDASRPHMRVMGISHVYLAPDKSVPKGCAPPPSHEQVLGPDFENGRADPPSVRLMLAQWRGSGKARVIDRPAGTFRHLDGNASVLVDNFAFKPSLLSIPRGSSLTWRFRDDFIHDATVVRGPRGFATKTVRNRNQRIRFTVPGEYRLYCSIHPVLMAQVVKVR